MSFILVILGSKRTRHHQRLKQGGISETRRSTPRGGASQERHCRPDYKWLLSIERREEWPRIYTLARKVFSALPILNLFGPNEKLLVPLSRAEPRRLRSRKDNSPLDLARRQRVLELDV